MVYVRYLGAPTLSGNICYLVGNWVKKNRKRFFVIFKGVFAPLTKSGYAPGSHLANF